jgi:hypothetical protein
LKIIICCSSSTCKTNKEKSKVKPSGQVKKIKRNGKNEKIFSQPEHIHKGGCTRLKLAPYRQAAYKTHACT